MHGELSNAYIVASMLTTTGILIAAAEAWYLAGRIARWIRS